MGVNSWLFLLSNPSTHCFLLLATLTEMEWRKEGETKRWGKLLKLNLLQWKFPTKSWRGKTSLSNKRTALLAEIWVISPRPSFWRQKSSFFQHPQIVLSVRGLQGDCYFFCILFCVFLKSGFILLFHCYHVYLLFNPYSLWPSRLGMLNTPTASLQRGKTPPTNVLIVTQNNLIVRLQ